MSQRVARFVRCGMKALRVTLIRRRQAWLGRDLFLHNGYMWCFAWSNDSKAILFRITGYGNRSGRAYRMDWIGTYDVLSDRVAADLANMNNNAVTVWDPKEAGED